jgi:hypothetical protein
MQQIWFVIMRSESTNAGSQWGYRFLHCEKTTFEGSKLLYSKYADVLQNTPGAQTMLIFRDPDKTPMTEFTERNMKSGHSL